LPNVKLERKEYLEVAKRLNLIGGKWKGGKVQGFVFDFDPSGLLAQISDEGKDINLKKEYQFFETPEELAGQLVDLANIKPCQNVLEPSAGRGAIVKEILKRHPTAGVYGFELMDINRTFLKDISGFHLFDEPDFLKYKPEKFIVLRFDRIVANPPFSKNQDIDHIRHMYGHLAPDGILVSVASNHWKTCENRKETEFREWLHEKGAEVIDIPAGTFKQSGTSIAACIIRIQK
jgi:type I restriction-modification system DNA methylase subunit